MQTTFEIGTKLVALCNQNKFLEAVDSLYAPEIVSIEPHGGPGGERRMEGIAAVRGKNEWWMKNHDVHQAAATGPWPSEDRFIVHFKIDVTAKAGPMAGKRFQMEEAGLYTVKNGKIVTEEFFFQMGG